MDSARRKQSAAMAAAKEAARVEAINLRDTQYERRAPTYAEFYATDKQLEPACGDRAPVLHVVSPAGLDSLGVARTH